MNDQLLPNPEAPPTEPVKPGPVTGLAPGVLEASSAATIHPMAAQARWARVGLLGIGAAALIAVAALAFGSTATPSSTLAGTTGTTGSTSTTSGIGDLHGGPGFPGGRGGLGFGAVSITTISGSSISLATEDGWTRTITVDDGTTYTKAGDDITLGDLAVGDTIGFRQTKEEDGSFTIDAIAVILPHAGGEVTAIDGSKITVTQRDDTTVTIDVASDANIVVNGDAATLADIKVGMFLVAEGTKNSDGSLDAVRVHAGDRGVRGGGGRGFGGHGPFDDDGASPDSTAAPSATSSAT